jgi:two-component system, NtrC family, response regulator HydG
MFSPTVLEEDMYVAAIADPLFCGAAPEMAVLAEQVRRVALEDTTLLVSGESGAGKTHLARLVHELSARRDQPFLVVDCGALSPNQLEREMFGQAEGGFGRAIRRRQGKLAAARAGTLVLDEINSLPLPLQAKLLRAVVERVFEPFGSKKSQSWRARLIVVSNAPLELEVRAGRFRSDLYERLSGATFELPPLRQRRSAIAPLAVQFVAKLAGRNRPDVRGLARSAVQALEDYAWPGNIRELRNIIERTLAHCAGPKVLPCDLPQAVRNGAAGVTGTDGPPSALAQPATLLQAQVESELCRVQDAIAASCSRGQRTPADPGTGRRPLHKKPYKHRVNRLI